MAKVSWRRASDGLDRTGEVVIIIVSEELSAGVGGRCSAKDICHKMRYLLFIKRESFQITAIQSIHMAVFLTDDGSLSPAGIYLSFGLPLLLIENKARHFNGFLFYFGIILSVFCLVLFVLFRLKESRMGQKRLIRKDEPLSSIINKLSDHSESRDYVVQCIHALYMAINAEKIAHAKANDASAQKPPQNSKADSMLDLNIQQLISHCLEKHPNDDLIGNVCFGLMTAFATSKSFATAIVEEADTKGIDTHIKFMKRSLERSKNESETDEKSQGE